MVPVYLFTCLPLHAIPPEQLRYLTQKLGLDKHDALRYNRVITQCVMLIL